MTREIELTQGKVALVDDDDHEYLSQFNWCADKNRKRFYAKRIAGQGMGGRCKIYMHRVILSAPEGVAIDHIDGDGLNNTRSNLRLASNSQNTANADKYGNNASGYKGVSRYARDMNWRAYIKINGHQHHLGYFQTPEAAAHAYDEAAREHFGEFAKTNFQVAQ